MNEILYSLKVLSGQIQDQQYCDISLENLICMLDVLVDIRQQPSKKSQQQRTKLNDTSVIIPVKKNKIYHLPVMVDLPSGDIGSIFIHLNFDSSVTRVINASFEEKIFPSEEYLTYTNLTIPDSALLGMHAKLTPVSTSDETVAYFDFEFTGGNCDTTTVSFQALACNEHNVSGGFPVDDIIYQKVSFALPCFYTIVSSAGENGSISPVGSISVEQFTEAAFSMMPDEDFRIAYISVDGEHIQDKHPLYTFTHIDNNHEIYVHFEKKPPIYVKNPISHLTVKEDSPSETIELSSLFGVLFTNEYQPISVSVLSNSNEQLVHASITDNVMTLNFQKEQSGSATIEILGQSIGCMDGTWQFSVYVEPVNDPPVISEITNQIIDINQSSQCILFTIDDVDTPISYLHVWAESSNPDLLPENSNHITFGGIGAERTVTLKPLSSSFGDADIYLFVSDGFHTSQSTFSVHVNRVSYLIKTIIEKNGTVNHPENLTVTKGDHVKYIMFPDDGYHVENLMINGNSMGPLDEYTFWSVADNYTLSILFSESQTYTVKTIASTGGKIFPENITYVNQGENLHISFKADPGYCLNNILINDRTIDSTNRYLLKNITENFVIRADFIPVSRTVADFTSHITKGNKPLTVKFMDRSSPEISSWKWEFGDGFNSSNQYPVHTYSAPGRYTVTLQVSGPGGTDTIIKPDAITVESNQFDFITDHVNGNAPLWVSFSDQSQGYTILSWACGNGQTVSVMNPVCKYIEPGDYSVTAFAENSSHETYTMIRQNYIHVTGRTIQGKVSDDQTGAGISQCLVEIWQMNSDLSGMTFTDENGNYTVSNLPLSQFYMIVWPPFGSDMYAHQYYDHQHNKHTADILSTVSGNLKKIDITLKTKPAYGLRGFVKNEQGQGLKNMTVNIDSDSIDFRDSTQTDENGCYTFTGLEQVSDYKISVWSETLSSAFYYAIPENTSYTQYTPIVSDTVHFLQKATPVTPLNPFLENITIFVYSDGMIKGNVFIDDQPVQGIRIRAWSDQIKSGNSALTDENGCYTIAGLIAKSDTKPVTYIVDIASDNYYYQAYNNVNSPGNATPVTTGTFEVNFFLETTRTLTGNVYDHNGIEVPYVDINAWSRSNPLIKNGSTISNEKGAYSLTLQRADDYILAAYPKGYPALYYNSAFSVQFADTIDLNSDNLDNINFILDKGASISGNVFIEDIQGNLNAANSGINVMIWSEKSNQEYHVQTDANGFYEIIGLMEDVDDYKISIRHQDYMPSYYQYDSNNTTVHRLREASGLSPFQQHCNLVLSKGFSIKGKVLSDNNPVSDVRIDVWSNDNDFFQTTLSLEELVIGCNFYISGLTPGTYQIKATSTAYKDKTQYITIVDTDIHDINFELEHADRIISGIISGIDRATRVQMHIQSKLMEFEQNLILESKGTEIPYTITGLKASSDYIVEIYSNDFPYYVYNQCYHRDNAQYIDLTSEDFFKADFVIEQLNLKTISGTLSFPSDAKMGAAARISAISEKGTSGSVQVIYTGKAVVPYTITGLVKADDYIVSAESDHYQTLYYSNVSTGSDATLVDISDGSVSDIHFVFSTGNSISGYVYSYGNPADGLDVSAWSEKTKSFGNTQTQEDGSFIIYGLDAADDFIVKVKKSGVLPFFYFNNESSVRNETMATPISTINGSINNIQVFITEGYRICGNVYSIAGQPLSDIQIRAESETKKIAHFAYTTQTGMYCIDGLPLANDYMVRAIPSSNMNYVFQEKMNIPGNSTEINFILSNGYIIDGHIKDMNNNVIHKAKVEIQSTVNQYNQTVWTDSTGKFILQGIPSGSDFVISIFPPENSSLQCFHSSNIVVDSNSTKDIILMAGSYIEGYVNDMSGNAVSGAQITAFSKEENIQKNTQSDTNGYYKIDNLPQALDFELTVSSKNYVEIKKTDISTGSNIAFQLEESSDIRGTVKTADGVPLQNASICLSSELLSFERTYIVDMNGNFIASNLQAYNNGILVSDYQILVHIEGYSTLTKDHLSAGEQAHFIVPIGEISGFVCDSANQAIPSDIDVKAYLFKNMEKTLPTIISVKDGHFKFSGLSSESQYQIYFQAFGSSFTESKQWSGENDIGISILRRNDAKVYQVGDELDFKFNSTWR
jgi:PKD repeat protein